MGRLAVYTGPTSGTPVTPYSINSVDYTGSTLYDGNSYNFSTGAYVAKVSSYLLTYRYDGQRRLVSVRLYATGSSDSGLRVSYDYVYDGSNTLPSSRITTLISYGVSVSSKTEMYAFSGGNATTINGKSYAYDTSPNPYKGLAGFTGSNLFGVPDFNSLSGDALLNRSFSISEPFSDVSVKSFNQNNRTINAQLTYNSDGSVTKIAYTDGNSEEFTYEIY